MQITRLVPTLGVVAALTGVAGSANAELVYGLTDSAAPALVSFESAAAGTLLNVGSITGITAGQTLRAIDFRPSNGQLYALSSAGSAAQLYTINTTSFVATAIGSGLTLAGNGSTRISIDFNPVVDALRVVTGSGLNYRVNPGTGALIAQDTTLTPSGSLISGIAYTNNVVGATQTTLYAYDYLADTLNTIGGINGAPSPNGGALTTVGASGVVAFSAGMGFDISGATGVAYLTLDDASTATAATEFYRVNLATGTVTLLGNSPTALLDVAVVAAIPEASTHAMMLAGVAMLGIAIRRRRAR